MQNNRGFTLIEILITMGLVIAVLVITGSAFNAILKTTGGLVSSEGSNIEGVVGLEMFRHDIQQCGLGLPHEFGNPAPPQYAEAAVAPANTLNDGSGTVAAPGDGKVPRAIASWNDLVGASDAISEPGVTYSVLNGTDYLVIKSASIGTNTAARKWTYLTLDGVKIWPEVEDRLVDSEDQVIVVNRKYSTDGMVTNILVYTAPENYGPTYKANLSDWVDVYKLIPPLDTYYVYGITRNNANPSTPLPLVMPFNRADYFVARPSDSQRIPSSCATNTGILYKATVNHGAASDTKTGKLTYMPLVDCVADMQVVFGWDFNNDGVIEESSAYEGDVAKIFTSGSTITPSSIKTVMETSADIRSKLKWIKVYIMAQEGRRDSGFTNTAPINVGDTTNTGLTKAYTVADLVTKGWLNYRWKVYRIIINPNSL